MLSFDIEQIKSISIIEVASRLGINIRGKKAFCFDGHDTKPSLSFKLDRNNWKCFGCGKGGNNINLVMEVLRCDFKQALYWFSTEFNVNIQNSPRLKRIAKKERRHKSFIAIPIKSGKPKNFQNEFSADIEIYTWFLEKCKPVSSLIGKEYLRNHGISQDLANRFDICELVNPKYAFHKTIEKWGNERVFKSGMAWGNDGKAQRLIWTSYALLFPFKNDNSTIYIQGRLFLGNKKYVNLKGIAKPLFNDDILISSPPGHRIHICEGITDAIALEGAGFSSVAVLGATSFRSEWVEAFLRFEIMLLPDGDEGGKRFAEIISGYFKKRGKSTRLVRVPEGEDVASFIAKSTPRE